MNIANDHIIKIREVLAKSLVEHNKQVTDVLTMLPTPPAEEENLIEPSEENVRHWTQRIQDLHHEGGYTDRNIEKVIRELLSHDTYYSAHAELKQKIKALLS